MLRLSRPYLGAALLAAVSFAACSSDEGGSALAPTSPSVGGSSGIPTVDPIGVPGGAGTTAGTMTSAGAGTTAFAGTGGRPPATGGMSGVGVAGMNAAGMPGARDAGAPDAGGACNPASGDSDRDGTPDCSDECPMDPGKKEPGTCGCGKSDADANMNGAADCMDTPTAGTGGMPGAADDPNACKVGPIPTEVRSEYKLDAFYTRYASAAGTPIVATNNPVDESISRACRVVLDLSSTIPTARERMRTDHVYFIMMAKNEKTVQTPEYRSRGDLDARARGFGNNPGLCAEENVMCDRTTDRWRGESICVHEYAHVMHLYVWNKAVPMFNTKVNAAYQNAVRTMGKYKNTYAASNATEYFAELVQNWYNTNLQSQRGEAGDGVHNHVNTRSEMESYDPMGYALVKEVLPDVPKYKDCYYYDSP